MKKNQIIVLSIIAVIILIVLGSYFTKKDAGYIFTSRQVAEMYCDGVNGLLYYKGMASSSNDWCVLNPVGCPNTCKDEGYKLLGGCKTQPSQEPACGATCTNEYTCSQGTIYKCGAVISVNCANTGFDGTCKAASGTYSSNSAAQSGLCSGCSSTNTLICSGGNVYNYNECNGRGSKVQDCAGLGCNNGVCNTPPPSAKVLTGCESSCGGTTCGDGQGCYKTDNVYSCESTSRCTNVIATGDCTVGSNLVGMGASTCIGSIKYSCSLTSLLTNDTSSSNGCQNNPTGSTITFNSNTSQNVPVINMPSDNSSANKPNPPKVCESYEELGTDGTCNLKSSILWIVGLFIGGLVLLKAVNRGN